MSIKRLVVVGGGIAGLAAAWTARRLADTVPGGLEVLVLERESAVGGKARTVRDQGYVVETGPTGFLSGRPELTRLIAEASLDGEVLPANPAAAHRFLVRKGRLREIPLHPLRFARSGLLSPFGLLRLLGEPLIPRRTGAADESVWEFAARRLGRQVADRLVAPMALGVFAGDAKRLSLSAAFPRMAALEAQYGSLLKAVAARRGSTSSGALTSFHDGMETLPRTLATRGGFEVRCGTAVMFLRLDAGRWRVGTSRDREPIPADAVLLCCEAPAAAALVLDLAPDACAALRAIPYPPVAVVALGYPRDACRGVPVGFGALIARTEGYRMLGNLWDTYLYPGRSPEGTLLIRVMFGGAVDPGVEDLVGEDLVALAVGEVERLYGIRGSPSYQRVIRWPRAIPQYDVGHRERVAAIEAAAARLPGLAIAGAGLHGVAFPDAAGSGVRAGEGMVTWLRQGAGVGEYLPNHPR